MVVRSENIAGMDLEIQPVAQGGPRGRIPFNVGLVLALIGIGLPMIGVTINLWLGFGILLIAFALIAWGCWIWEGRSPRRKLLRIVTTCIFAVVYFSLIGIQIRAQYRKDHPLHAGTPATPTTIINQKAKDSPCANEVAQGGSQINCGAQKGKDDKTNTGH